MSTTTTPRPVTRPARRDSLLRHRDFRLLWIGQTGSKLGSSITSVALPLIAVATLDAGPLQVSVLTAATWLPWLLIGLPAGALVDRLPRRPVMLACDVVSALAFLSVPLAAGLGVLTVTHLVLVASLAGTASVFFHTAYQVYLPALLRADQMAEGNAKLQGTEAAAQVAGPGAAGLLTSLFGAVAGLLVDALTFLGSAACLLSIRARERNERSESAHPTGHPDPERSRAETAQPTTVGQPTGTLLREISAGLRFVAADPYLRVLTVFGAASNLFLVGYQAILVPFLVREVGMAPGAVGYLVAAMSLGGVIGAVCAPAAARRLGTARALLLSELCAAPFGLLLPLTGTGARAGLAVAAGVIIGTGVVIGNVIKGSFRQTYTPHHLLGRVISGMQIVNYGTIPIGALLGGGLAAVLGTRTTMWLMTAGLALTGLILLVGPIRRHRDLPDRPVSRP